jgi:omega-amidase
MRETVQNNIHIAAVQFNIAWHDVTGNLLKIESLLKKLNTKVDIIVLPEMFATGFTHTPEVISIERQNAVLEWMKEISSKFNAAILGSHPFFDDGKYYNRLLFVTPGSNIDFYNKRHLFSMGDENKKYTAGSERKIMNWKGWSIMPQICYDLRFPVWGRNNLNYDLLIYCANWPEVRINTWEILLKARAIENQCYVIGINRIGIDGQNIRYSGKSQILSPLGKILGSVENEEDILVIELQKDKLERLRRSFPVLDDTDIFEIK